MHRMAFINPRFVRKSKVLLVLGTLHKNASENSGDSMNFLTFRFPGFRTKIPDIFSTVTPMVTQSKLQKIFVRSSQAFGWFCAKLVNSILWGTVTTQHYLR